MDYHYFPHEVAHVWCFNILRQTHLSLLVGKVTHVWIRSAIVGALGGEPWISEAIKTAATMFEK